MGVISAVLFLLAFVLIWALLPYLPGLREIWQQTDKDPLRITRGSEVDIRYFARGFRALITGEVAEAVDASREASADVSGVFASGDRWLAVAAPHATPCIPPLEDDGVCATVILSGGPLELPPETVHTDEVYGAAAVRGGRRSVYRAFLAGGEARLDRESVVLRWIHADGELYAGTGTLLYGRASSDVAVTLEEGCGFARLNAPRIDFGIAGGEPSAPAGAADDDLRSLEPKDLANRVEVTGRRWLIWGKCEIPAHRSVDADLVVTGRFVIGAGCRVDGSVKSRKKLEIGRGVCITGSAVSARGMDVGEGARIGGPLIAERELVLARHCRIGSPEVPTTVSAETITCHGGARCFGTVWAHESGVVRVPADATAPADATDHATKETVS